MTARRERLKALAELQDRWVAKHLASARAQFDPRDYPKPGSDYNQHHIELDADGAAQDEFFDAAMVIVQGDSNV